MAARPTGASDVRIILGDCRDVLPTLDAESVDAVVTDPPYDLTSIARRFGKPGSAPAKGPAFQRHNRGFMGQAWDGTGVAFDPATWEAVLRVLKPGGHLLAFGGTRTYHRLVCAVEDAGFEIRDTLMWLYGSGFPKSLDVSKAIDKAAGAERERIGKGRPMSSLGVMHDDDWRSDPEYAVTAPATEDAARWQGWGTALKPAVEPIVLARKPLAERSVAAQVLSTGTGAINVDACRIETDGRPARAPAPKASANGAVYAGRQSAGTGYDGGSHAVGTTTEGRWPANVILSHTPECVREAVIIEGFGPAHEWHCSPDCPVAMLDEQSGGHSVNGPAVYRSEHQAVVYGGGLGHRRPGDERPGFGDTGGASRFYYTAKADSAERSHGLASRNSHPTVKPVDLMAWLCRLVTPPGGTILDPFLGSGTTAIAAQGCGFSCIGIEQSAEYVALAQQRIGMFCSVETHPR